MTSVDTLAKLQADYGSAEYSKNWQAWDAFIWDMAGYNPAGTSSLVYFAQPNGANDPGLQIPKKKEQTNLVTQNQIGGGECFIATHIRCFILNAAKCRQTGVAGTGATGVVSDTQFAARQLAYAKWVNALVNVGALTLTIMDKKYLIEANPWQTFPAGFGLGTVIPPAVGGTAAINGGANAYANGSPYDIDGGTIGDTFSLAQPVFLAPNTPFECNINFRLANSPAATGLYVSSIDQSAQPATIWTGVVLCGWKVRPRQ